MRRARKAVSIPAAAAATFVAAYLLTPPGGSAPQSAKAVAASIATATYYLNCDAARAAGAAPIHAGQPGYRDALDRDRDGIACEPFRY